MTVPIELHLGDGSVIRGAPFGVRMGRLGAVVRLKKNAPSSACGAGAFPSFRVSRPGGLRERIAEHLAVEHIACGIRRIYTKRMLISARSSALTVRGGFLKWFGIDESRDYSTSEMTTMPRCERLSEASLLP